MGDGATRKLKATVHLDGEVYAAGTKVSAEVAARIDNPKAWGKDSTPSGGAPESNKQKAKDEKPAGDSDELNPPSKVAGSAAKWREYGIAAAAAAGLQIEIPEGAKRGEIIEALEGAKIRTE